MNTSIGLSAFPHEGLGGARSSGMTLRDYLACHASDQDVSMTIHDYFENNYTSEGYQPITRQQARYMFADAMLEARRK